MSTDYPKSSPNGIFVSFQHPNFRLWFSGQLVSLVGTWMQSTAQGYLIYVLTGSSAYLGYIAIASGIPTWFFTLYGGVIADRISRRTLLVITQTAMMVLAFISICPGVYKYRQTLAHFSPCFFIGNRNSLRCTCPPILCPGIG